MNNFIIFPIMTGDPIPEKPGTKLLEIRIYLSGVFKP